MSWLATIVKHVDYLRDRTEVVGIDAYPVTGQTVPCGQLGDAAQLVPVDLRVALQLHLEVWCAIECALLDLFARERGQSVEALLDLPPPGS